MHEIETVVQGYFERRGWGGGGGGGGTSHMVRVSLKLSPNLAPNHP